MTINPGKLITRELRISQPTVVPRPHPATAAKPSLLLKEARLERAEGMEIRRQLREALAELESNRNAQARRARTDVQACV